MELILPLVRTHTNVLHQTTLRALTLTCKVHLLLVLRRNRSCAHDTVCVGMAHDHFSILDFLLPLLLQSRMVLLLDIVLIPVEQFLN